MGAIAGTIICLSYIIGLLLAGVLGQVWGIPASGLGMLAVGLVGAIALPHIWRMGPRGSVWLVAGIVGCLASLHLQVRTPVLGGHDVYHLLNTSPSESQTIYGFLDTAPRLTRSGKTQFVLDTFQATAFDFEAAGVEAHSVVGKVYVTVPTEPNRVLYPGQMVAIRGRLYDPKPAVNPGGFDFQAYLARSGIFTGAFGETVENLDGSGRFGEKRSLSRRVVQPIRYGLWWVRQRVGRSHLQGLGQPEGPLVSGMVLGKGGADVPFDLRDTFASVGLAHTLAASGFHVSLLLGCFLFLTQNLSGRSRLILGAVLLIGYAGLAGMQPSVLRATVMGLAVLLAMSLEHKTNPLGSLLLAGTVLLAINPLWIWDLGFQLSFLATLGLLVLVPTLMKWLDWLPIVLGSSIAVPIAATVWTIPLQLYVFGVISPYSIGLNVVAAPLISIITLGGAISGAVAIVLPAVGGWLAALLKFPTVALIWMAEHVGQLPGSQFATGTISVGQVAILYGLFALVWWVSGVQRFWWIVSLGCVGLVAIPAWLGVQQRFQATILATADAPVMVIQKRDEVGLIGGMSDRDAQFVVLPFLRKQGVNEIRWAIAPQLRTQAPGWLQILKKMPIRALYNASGSALDPGDAEQQSLLQQLGKRQGQAHFLPNGEAIALGSTPVRLVNLNPLMLRFQLGEQIWLMIGNQGQHAVPPQLLSAATVIWSLGKFDNAELLAAVRPNVAIASSSKGSDAIAAAYPTVQFFTTEQEGAIEWSPKTNFQRTIMPDAE
ncbi:ComEC/Rec2 family competence protein [Leptolyngbya sp. AN02str]|uniref:ComEC/Rec2 family competence protein n=1 Tax=Leptolyngbya sp. AN02str TaxID=3423363 RepID=UPI003D32353F